jgi:hypothetical protein
MTTGIGLATEAMTARHGKLKAERQGRAEQEVEILAGRVGGTGSWAPGHGEQWSSRLRAQGERNARDVAMEEQGAPARTGQSRAREQAPWRDSAGSAIGSTANREQEPARAEGRSCWR